MAIRAKYKGNGSEFHAGIPARDLEEDEYQALDVEQRKLVRESPLYSVKTDAEMGGNPSTAASAPPEKNGEGKSAGS